MAQSRKLQFLASNQLREWKGEQTESQTEQERIFD